MKWQPGDGRYVRGPPRHVDGTWRSHGHRRRAGSAGAQLADGHRPSVAARDRPRSRPADRPWNGRSTPAQEPLARMADAMMTDLNETWGRTLGDRYQPTTVVLFTDRVDAEGAASRDRRPGRSTARPPARSTSTWGSTASSTSGSARPAISRRPTCSRTKSGTTCSRCSGSSRRSGARSRPQPQQAQRAVGAHGAAGRLLRRRVGPRGRAAGRPCRARNGRRRRGAAGRGRDWRRPAAAAGRPDASRRRSSRTARRRSASSGSAAASRAATRTRATRSGTPRRGEGRRLALGVGGGRWRWALGGGRVGRPQRPLPNAYRQPPTAYRLPPTAHRLPPTAYRPPPTALPNALRETMTGSPRPGVRLADGSSDRFFLHLDAHLAELTTSYGPWIYAILFAIIFAETGLVVTAVSARRFAAVRLRGAGRASASSNPWLTVHVAARGRDHRQRRQLLGRPLCRPSRVHRAGSDQLLAPAAQSRAPGSHARVLREVRRDGRGAGPLHADRADVRALRRRARGP